MDINGMKITDVVVYPVHPKVESSKLYAFAKVVLNDQFIVHGIRVYEGINGPFMTFPQDYNKSNKDGVPYSICHPTTAELRNYISEQVMAEYALTMSAANHTEASPGENLIGGAVNKAFYRR
jgi:stage V sporulation protein G